MFPGRSRSLLVGRYLIAADRRKFTPPARHHPEASPHNSPNVTQANMIPTRRLAAQGNFFKRSAQELGRLSRIGMASWLELKREK